MTCCVRTLKCVLCVLSTQGLVKGGLLTTGLFKAQKYGTISIFPEIHVAETVIEISICIEDCVAWKVPCMQASMSRSFFVVADHIGLLAPLGSIKPVAPSAPCLIDCG